MSYTAIEQYLWEWYDGKHTTQAAIIHLMVSKPTFYTVRDILSDVLAARLTVQMAARRIYQIHQDL